MTTSTFPKLTGLALAGCLGAGLAHRAWADLAVRRGHRDYERRTLRCGSGNILDHHVRRGAPDGPVLVLEAGLMNTSAAWLLVADLLDPALTVVLYDRAGYRASLRRCPEDYSLNESATDLAELVTAVTDELPDTAGPLVVAGHSLGGYLGHRAAALTDRIRGLVLVDPTHPHELLRSRRQREGSRGVNLTMKLGPWSAAFGAGLLIDKKGLFAYADGNPHQRTLRIEGSAVPTWRAALREWNYSYAFMLDGGRPLDRLDIPVSVIAAESTLRDTPEHGELYEDYLASGTGGEIVTVPGSTHLSVTGGVDHAPRTAEAIEAAIAAITAGRTRTAPHEETA
ncbi:alpha/beta hydrolase (plasmid) [Streptomyces sp. BI20]|uniref:alpha/beta hydrolase n=1 Tax=Streptomyces sp. BI20 TaxID=3403460 RepID=UPI003C75F21A